jgi:hypothetical protein
MPDYQFPGNFRISVHKERIEIYSIRQFAGIYIQFAGSTGKINLPDNRPKHIPDDQF